MPADLAGVAEGLEVLFAAEVEGDRGAAADRVGDVDAFGVGLGGIAPMSKLGLPCLIHCFGAKTALRWATKAPNGARPSV